MPLEGHETNAKYPEGTIEVGNLRQRAEALFPGMFRTLSLQSSGYPSAGTEKDQSHGI